MLDKPHQTDVVVRPQGEGAPAIFVRLNAQIGQNRTIELSFGIPLDMRPADLNAYLDKVSACVDRQNEKGLLEFAKNTVQDARKKILEQEAHIAAYHAKHEAEWYAKGKMGEFKPTGSQSAEIKNFETNIKDLREKTIPQWEKQIKELERKIAGED